MSRQSLTVKSFSIMDEGQRCCNCAQWCGRCLKGRINKIACSPACEIFEPKYSAMYVIPEIVATGATAPMEVKA